jgi:hypothetical protein
MKPRWPALAGALTFVAAVSASWAQTVPAPPNVTRSQRAALQAIVRAMDGGTAISDVADDRWPLHLLRASDGSHYVAFSVPAAAASTSKRPVVLYVRLSTRRDPRITAPAERSAVGEWLAGQTPAPPLNRPGIAFGEMPTYGAGAIAARGPGPQSLQLLEMERERARERREAEERTRKATLEGEAPERGPRPLLPFEDFDVRAVATSTGQETPLFRRSLTAGPGEYDLVVGWADPEARDLASSVRVVRRRLSLPPASTTEFALSSVIVADNVAVRETPVPAAEQSARPYSIASMDITPAGDHFFTNDERLALVVQVINARGSPTGKPDVAIGFRVFRNNSGKEEVVGTLAPQTYNESTLPPDFDATKRHPIFAAVAVPLRSFRRGAYRLEVAGNDRIAGTGTISNATFTIIGSPPALLREAPPLGRPFQREQLFATPILNELLAKLAPSRPSAAFAAALEQARAKRFVELIRDDAVAPEELPARTLLRALALYAIGESAASLATPLRQALAQAVAPAAVHLMLGAVRVLEGNDRDAIAAWEAAVEAGTDAQVVAPLVADALLRQGDAARAVAVAERSVDADHPDIVRRLAAGQIALGRHADAIRVLEAALARDPTDTEAQWLVLRALFAGFVAGTGPGADSAGRARLVALADQYVAAKGRHEALAREWADAVR